jgi:hypothetical protein
MRIAEGKEAFVHQESGMPPEMRLLERFAKMRAGKEAFDPHRAGRLPLILLSLRSLWGRRSVGQHRGTKRGQKGPGKCPCSAAQAPLTGT